MKKKSKKTIEREKDILWRIECLRRDNFKCQICKKRPNKPQVHHIIPKQFKDLKYNIDNGITLCYQHHKVNKCSPHQNSLWFYKWLETSKSRQFENIIKLINIKC